MILVLLYIPGPENGDIKQAASHVLTEVPKEIKWQWWCLQFHLPFSLLSFSPLRSLLYPLFSYVANLGCLRSILLYSVLPVSLFWSFLFWKSEYNELHKHFRGYITKQSLVWVWICLCVVYIGKKAILSLSLTLPSNSSALLPAWTLPHNVWHRPGNWDTTHKPLAWCFDSQLEPVSSGF